MVVIHTSSDVHNLLTDGQLQLWIMKYFGAYMHYFLWKNSYRLSYIIRILRGTKRLFISFCLFEIVDLKLEVDSMAKIQHGVTSIYALCIIRWRQK